MSEPSAPQTAHPDELLADFVTGSVGPGDRSLVEGHLASCSRCRGEVAAARAARAALLTLPDVDAPGVRLEEIYRSEKVLADGTSTGGVAELERRRRRPSLQGIAALAAAAAFIVIGGVLLFGGRTSPQDTGSVTAPATNGSQGLLRTATDYSAASFDSLATSLAGHTPGPRAPGAGALQADGSGASGPMRAERGTVASPLDPASAAAIGCVERATGLGSGARFVYLEQASFLGAPAYVAALVQPQTGGHGVLLVVAVSVDGCQPLRVDRIPL